MKTISILSKSFIVIIFTIFLSINCYRIKERPFKKKLNNIEYGEIHKMGGRLMICVKGIDNISFNEIVNFLYCLEDQEESKGRYIDSIEFYKYYYYIDQIEASHLTLRASFKDVFDVVADKFKAKIISINKIENGRESILPHPDINEIKCENDY